MRRLVAFLIASLASLPLLSVAQGMAAADANQLAIGQRIYREGVLPSGQRLSGMGPANVRLSGSDAACTTCHRRSGYGSSEGLIEVRPITGPSLFGSRMAPPVLVGTGVSLAASAPPDLSPAEAVRVKADTVRAARAAALAGVRPRTTYNEVSLARAIREGVDVTGRSMSPSMPRYALEPAEIESLSAYLKTLSVQISPGVTEDAVHFSTVIQPGTDPAHRRSVVEVLEAFFRDRNLSMRSEARREDAGIVRLKRTYREWVLHVWDLSGEADTWGRQLEAYNKRQPVFAMVSGLGNASWRPIHEFSERFEVPCIFPQADVPFLANRDFYTVYLSKGITLEGQALAKFLASQGQRGPVTQVFRRDDASATGAEAFRKAWTADAGATLVDRVLDVTPDEAFWQRLAQQDASATLVLWLGSKDLTQAQILTAAASRMNVVYLSSSLNRNPRSGLAADAGGRVRLIYPQDLPAEREARLELVKRWLRKNGIAPADENVQMNAYLAATVTGMLVSHSMDTYSRELLLERMEHRLGTALETSIYPRLSLGPGQRYASKGSFIVKVGGAEDPQLKAVSDWIVP